MPVSDRASQGEEEDLVRRYLADIGKYELLDKKGEVMLARKIRMGLEATFTLEKSEADGKSIASVDRKELEKQVRIGDKATERFTQSNLRLVVSIAKKYQASGLPLLDLVQEGNLGLMHAVEKFDERKGFKFSTYATWWIRQAITRGIANTGKLIRLPVHAGDTVNRIQKARHTLERALGRTPTLAEIAEELGISQEKVLEASRYSNDPISFSTSLRESGDVELEDMIEDRTIKSQEDETSSTQLPEEVDRLLQCLEEREREILKLRYGLTDNREQYTLEDVGEKFQLTRERIRQIESRAMSKLRHPSTDTGIRDLV